MEEIAKKYDMNVEEFIVKVFEHYVDCSDIDTCDLTGYVTLIKPKEVKEPEVSEIVPWTPVEVSDSIRKDVDDLYRKYEQMVKEVGRMEKDLALMQNFLREKFGYKRW